MHILFHKILVGVIMPHPELHRQASIISTRTLDMYQQQVLIHAL